MTHQPRKLFWLAVAGFVVAFVSTVNGSSEPTIDIPKTLTIPDMPLSLGARVWDAIAPTTMQKRPVIWFNVISEKTEEGRRFREPTPDKPMYYYLSAGKFRQIGVAGVGGEKPPPVKELDDTMRRILAANGYLPTSQPEQRPEIAIVFSYGSHGIDAPPDAATDFVGQILGNPHLFRDVIERATLIGGEKFSKELKAVLDEEAFNMRMNRNGGHYQVSPEFGSPFQLFAFGAYVKNGPLVSHLAEVAFHTCYFVVASAYEFSSLERKQPQLLWRTKMTVSDQGVSMEETLKPLIAYAGPYLGRDMPEAVIVKKQIYRDGKVTVGTPTLVEEAPKTPATKSEEK
ncbi:MAG: hypothetical protein ABIO94_01180 [Opitutaceae bacterium]